LITLNETLEEMMSRYFAYAVAIFSLAFWRMDNLLWRKVRNLLGDLQRYNSLWAQSIDWSMSRLNQFKEVADRSRKHQIIIGTCILGLGHCLIGRIFQSIRHQRFIIFPLDFSYHNCLLRHSAQQCNLFRTIFWTSSFVELTCIFYVRMYSLGILWLTWMSLSTQYWRQVSFWGAFHNETWESVQSLRKQMERNFVYSVGVISITVPRKPIELEDAPSTHGFVTSFGNHPTQASINQWWMRRQLIQIHMAYARAALEMLMVIMTIALALEVVASIAYIIMLHRPTSGLLFGMFHTIFFGITEVFTIHKASMYNAEMGRDGKACSEMMTLLHHELRAKPRNPEEEAEVKQMVALLETMQEQIGNETPQKFFGVEPTTTNRNLFIGFILAHIVTFAIGVFPIVNFFHKIWEIMTGI